MKRRTNMSGFTLIELLVVIAIIAILAAILFPVFAQAKVAAKKARAISQMKQVGLSVHIYMGDNDDIYPPKVRWGFGDADPEPSMTWEKLIEPYVKNWDILASTEDIRPKYATPHGMFRRGFAPASNLFQGVQVPSSWGWPTKPGIAENFVPNVSRTVMFAEKRQRLYTTNNSPQECVDDPWNHECWFWDVQINNTRRDDMPISDPRAPYGELNNAYAGGSVFVYADTSTKFHRAAGLASDGVLHGTILDGYEEKAAWWVGTPDPFWDQGISCLDAGWGRGDDVCKLPGQ